MGRAGDRRKHSTRRWRRCLGELLCDDPRSDIRGAAGRKCNDDADRPVGISRLRDHRNRHQRNDKRSKELANDPACRLTSRACGSPL